MHTRYLINASPVKSKVPVTHIFGEIKLLLFSKSPVGNTPSDNIRAERRRRERRPRPIYIVARRCWFFDIFPENFDTPTNYGYWPLYRRYPAPQYNYVMPMIVILFTLLPASAGYLFRTQHVARFCFSRCPAPALSRAIFHNDERTSVVARHRRAFDHVFPMRSDWTPSLHRGIHWF